MYKVLIVDDEKYVRLWIRNCIDWINFDMEIVGEAINGKDALEKIEEYQPHVIITDMDMPIMDGVEFINSAKKLYPELIFLVISGYDKYEFMRSAICQNAVDYLLKPIDTQALKDSVEKIHSRLVKGTVMNNSDQMSVEMKKENLLLKQKMFMIDLFEGQISNDHDIAEFCSEYENDCPITMQAVTVLFDDPHLEENSFDSNHQIELEQLRMTAIAQLCSNFGELGIEYWYANNSNETTFIMIAKADDLFLESKITACFQKYFNSDANQSKLNVSVGMGNSVNRFEEIYASYYESVQALNLRFIYGSNQLFSFKHMYNETPEETICKIDEQMFADALHKSDMDYCNKLIRDLFNCVKESKPMSIKALEQAYQRIVHLLINEMFSSGLALDSLKTNESELFSRFQKFSNTDQVINHLSSLFLKISNLLSLEPETSNSAILAAKEYIENNFMDNLNLTDIANYTHITPSYLSYRFKTEIGVNILDYIADLRINEAKKLMKTSSLKTYEIGAKVGYTNEKYFCRVFKKIAGKTPAQYRRSLK